MSETLSNIEFAHKIHEKDHGSAPSEWIEILEVVALAIVAVATAWSSFQAAKWDGHSAAEYARASQATVKSQAKSAMARQDTLYDVITFNGWVGARLRGDEKLTAAFDEGVKMRETGDQYVKMTVLLATGLLLVALGQRFKRSMPRQVLVAIALTLLAGSSVYLLILPRA